MMIGPEPIIRTDLMELSFGIFKTPFRGRFGEMINCAKVREWEGFEGKKNNFCADRSSRKSRRFSAGSAIVVSVDQCMFVSPTQVSPCPENDLAFCFALSANSSAPDFIDSNLSVMES